jgi:hypothetical protein
MAVQVQVFLGRQFLHFSDLRKLAYGVRLDLWFVVSHRQQVRTRFVLYSSAQFHTPPVILKPSAGSRSTG